MIYLYLLFNNFIAMCDSLFFVFLLSINSWDLGIRKPKFRKSCTVL